MNNWTAEERVNASTQQRERIGGWLCLAAIGVFLGPMANFLHFTELVEEAQRANWSFIWQQGSVTVLAILFELGIQGYMLVFSLYLAVLFAGRKSKFPRMFIIYVVSLLILGIVGALMVVSIPNLPPDLVGEAMAFPIFVFMLGLIWISYFLGSRRVKRTFVVGQIPNPTPANGPTVPGEHLFCSLCGTKDEATAKFCWKCGAPMGQLSKIGRPAAKLEKAEQLIQDQPTAPHISTPYYLKGVL